MGTSISQPSPKGRNTTAKSWKSVKTSFQSKDDPQYIYTKIFKAYAVEYSNHAANTIIDPGVELVVGLLRNSNYQNLNPIDRLRFIGNFTLHARRELALGNCNSFFAELAVSCASATVMSNEDIDRKFSEEFLIKVIDYILSRDLPAIIGSGGVINLGSLKNLLNHFQDIIHQKIPRDGQLDCIEFLREEIQNTGDENE